MAARRLLQSAARRRGFAQGDNRLRNGGGVLNGFANMRRCNAPAAANLLRYLATGSFDRAIASIRMDFE